MNVRKLCFWGSCLSAISLASGCGGGGGGGGSSGSSPSAGIYRGVIRDADGNPVSGARVSIDGIEASAVTGRNGSYKIEDGELSTSSLVRDGAILAAADAADVEVAVFVPGFTPFVSSLSVTEGQMANVDLVQSGLEPSLTISSPRDQKTFVIAQDCDSPQVLVDGFASLGTKESFRLDVVAVIDRSGSTDDDAFDTDGDGIVDSLLEAEKAAVTCFLQGLNEKTTRVAVLQFNDSADTVQSFTNDLDTAISAVATVGPSSGGTNFEAAFSAARDAFVDLAADDAANAVADEEVTPETPTPLRAVVFISDGIATSHGVPRDTNDSNLTQSRADRRGAIDSASALGTDTGAQLFAYSIIPANDTNRTRTTLPHCVAACGGGRYESITEPSLLSESLCGHSLVSLLSVTVENVTTGDGPVAATLNSDGSFSQAIAVATGPSDVVGAPNSDGTVNNTIQITLTAFSGAMEMTTTQTVVVRVIDDVTFEQLNENEIFTATAASLPVAQTSRLNRPTGGALGDRNLYDMLVGSSAGEYEDAIELYGVETFTATDSMNAAVTLTLDLVHKEACYQSDVGYFLVNPSSPPTTVGAAMASAVVLWSTGSVGASNCNSQSIAAGSASQSITVDAGSVLAFFILPNRTLSNYLAHPRQDNAPLFSMNRLNPAGFDQALTFRSENGRTQVGSSTSVVTSGPLMIFAFDDQPTATRGADQDFDDIVFTVRGQAVARLEEVSCAE